MHELDPLDTFPEQFALAGLVHVPVDALHKRVQERVLTGTGLAALLVFEEAVGFPDATLEFAMIHIREGIRESRIHWSRWFFGMQNDWTRGEYPTEFRVRSRVSFRWDRGREGKRGGKKLTSLPLESPGKKTKRYNHFSKRKMSKRTTEVDVPPVEEEDRTEVSIWDALHSRNQLREYLKNEGTYTNLRKKHLSSFLTEDGTIHTSFVVNYVIGEHFKRGATNWRDLEDEARVFRHCLLNGYAHLVGTKVTPKGKLPSCQTVLIQEALVMPEVHPGEHGPVIRYRINGWRESMNTTITSAALADYNKKRQSQFRGKTQPAKDTNPRPKKKQRKDEEISESDEEAETDEQDEVGRIPMVASDTYSPIALAMEQSFEEASRLDKKITNERNNARNKAQQKANAAIVAGRKAPPSVDIPSIVLQGYDVKSMCPYSYLNAKDKLEFHAVVSGYIRPRTYAGMLQFFLLLLLSRL